MNDNLKHIVDFFWQDPSIGTEAAKEKTQHIPYTPQEGCVGEGALKVIIACIYIGRKINQSFNRLIPEPVNQPTFNQVCLRE